ncbi:hypothetical protein HPB51_027955 [Rhipicephalus microplus]|uniref:CCHC-type domain-containing protein n=1 Tax=Rhipicephalus microplus TaxID=6941 RepID=A0A9J6CYX1_RHIMP|nr:hypothetical protein HPB51_027955 [Rhipicephalus microplus]
MVPACYRCGTVGHRPDACPNPDNQRCIHCGAKVELTLEGPVKHDCQPEGLICGENYFAGSAQRVRKFRKAWKPALPQRQYGLKNKQEEPSAPLRTDEKANPIHNKPKLIKATAGKKPRPSTLGAEDFPSLANPPKQVRNWVGVNLPPPPLHPPPILKFLKQLEAMKKRLETLERKNLAQASQAATPPPSSEPVAMHTSDCSDDDCDNRDQHPREDDDGGMPSNPVEAVPGTSRHTAAQRRKMKESVRRKWTTKDVMLDDTAWKGELPPPPDDVLSPHQYFCAFFDEEMVDTL